ncbi:Rrf2 family transcriptional regulator [bacterium]|nr:Rrf2 family transcriptional regulator [bacterium]
MKLTTKGRYAARAMLELALHYRNGPLQLREIAQKQAISERYLERMMAGLVTAGLVRSTRGQHGGFSLAKDPGEILLSHIIQAVEGSLSLVDCVDDEQLCNRTDICITRDIWVKVKKAVLDVLDAITLEQMIEMQKNKLNRPESKMYHI